MRFNLSGLKSFLAGLIYFRIKNISFSATISLFFSLSVSFSALADFPLIACQQVGATAGNSIQSLSHTHRIHRAAAKNPAGGPAADSGHRNTVKSRARIIPMPGLSTVCHDVLPPPPGGGIFQRTVPDHGVFRLFGGPAVPLQSFSGNASYSPDQVDQAAGSAGGFPGGYSPLPASTPGRKDITPPPTILVGTAAIPMISMLSPYSGGDITDTAGSDIAAGMPYGGDTPQMLASVPHDIALSGQPAVVAEPSAMVLFLTGIAGLIVFRLRCAGTLNRKLIPSGKR